MSDRIGAISEPKEQGMRFRRKTKAVTPAPPPRAAKHVLPNAAFTVGAELYPLFVWALVQARLDGASFFVLSWLRRGKPYPNEKGRPGRLHSELTNALKKMLAAQFKDGKRASEFIEELHEAGLVRKEIPTTDVRSELTDDPSHERNMVVILTLDGELRLDTFNGYINESVDELLASVPRLKRRTIGYFANQLTTNEKGLIATARKLSERRLAEVQESPREKDNPTTT